MKCPQCCAPLFEVLIELKHDGYVSDGNDPATIHTCHSCKGFWLGPAAVLRISAMAGETLDGNISGALSEWPLEDAMCPVCETNLKAMHMGKEPEVFVLDFCKSCRGVWFEDGELWACTKKGGPHDGPWQFLDALYYLVRPFLRDRT